jgi:cardiolipin synthase
MSLDEELNVVAFDPEVTATLDAHFEEDIERAERIDPDRWEKRGIVQRAKEAAVSVLDREI